MFELTEEMKKEVCRLTAEKVFDHIKHNGKLDDILNAAKSKVANDLAATVAGSFHKRINVEDVVDKAVAGFEAKINARITKTLEKGVVVKLAT
jgi:hypothetical protein